MISAELIEEFAHRLRPLLPATGEFALPEMPDTAEALVVWALSRVLGRSVLWVGESIQRMETMHCDLATLQSYAPSSIQHLLYYPARDLLTEPRSATKHGQDPDPEITGQRFNTLLQLWTYRSDPTPRVLVTSIRALLQKMVSTSALLSRTFTLGRGQGEDLEQVRNRLAASGYRCVAEVEEKGTFAIRGGILDLWPVTQPWPARVEWAGSCVETIRLFDPVTQRSVEKLNALTVPPAGEWTLLIEDRHSSSFLTSWLPSSALLVWSHPDEITEQAEEYEAGLREAQVDHFACSYSDLLKELGKMGDLRQVRIGGTELSTDRVIPLDVHPLPVPLLTQEDIFSPDLLEQRRQQLLSELATRRRNGHRIFFFFDTQGSLEHFQRIHKRGQERGVTEVEWQLTVGVLSDGFVSDSMRLAVVAEPNLYGRRKLLGRRYDPGQRLRGTSERALGERVATLTDIEPGDLVVHVEHGVGRYEGMFEIEVNGEKQEVLTIEYAEGARLHVPVAQAHLLTRYVGLPGHKVRLHRVGGRRWTAEKAAAERAILGLASSLLETQARRQMLEGHRFSPDTPWQHDFEAAFP
ncbi:MAG: CarD family transcriptional regulator [Kiritimatiellia bacterium]